MEEVEEVEEVEEMEEVQVCPSEKLREAGTSSAVDETGDELLLGNRDNDVDDNDGDIDDDGDGIPGMRCQAHGKGCRDRHRGCKRSALGSGTEPFIIIETLMEVQVCSRHKLGLPVELVNKMMMMSWQL